MLPIAITDLAVAVSGRPKASISPWQYALGVSQSSQQVNPGDVFVAIIGKRVDGHDFIGQARDKGAVCAIVERYVDVKIPQILVASSVEAMGGIAKMYHARLQIPVVAVTGSVGKTSTKEMIAHVLSAKFRVHKGRDNFNNELGVPIESFRIAADDEISVLELAMRGRGQISYLSRRLIPLSPDARDVVAEGCSAPNVPVTFFHARTLVIRSSHVAPGVRGVVSRRHGLRGIPR